MKVEYRVFLWCVPFFFLIGTVYGVWTEGEPVGTAAIFLTGALVAMIGVYLAKTARHIDARPEDDPLAEIEAGAGDQGVYAPWSWWPLAIAFSGAIVFFGLAAGWWIVGIGVAVGSVALVGWVFEYSRGIHAH